MVEAQSHLETFHWWGRGREVLANAHDMTFELEILCRCPEIDILMFRFTQGGVPHKRMGGGYEVSSKQLRERLSYLWCYNTDQWSISRSPTPFVKFLETFLRDI